jgi:uncharacterized membrane protein YphA (DoxX/SURF4 family)
MSNGPKIVAWVLAILLGAMYVMAGIGKLGGGGQMFADWGYAPWFAVFIGICEILGGVGLIVPFTTRPAVLGLTLIMLGAIYTHVANSEGIDVIRPVAFLVVLWVIWWLRRPRETN